MQAKYPKPVCVCGSELRIAKEQIRTLVIEITKKGFG
jgi:hypothetical protein